MVLVGAAGSGKSTFAAGWFTPDEILSSDAYRASITGDAANQGATRAAFGALHTVLARRLRERRTAVVDATSVTARARLALLARARDAGVPAIAIVLDLPAAVVLARNSGRAERVVPTRVVERHLGELRRSLAGGGAALADEGFSNVIRFTDPTALDGARVIRG